MTTVLITGANRGLGFGMAKIYASRPCGFVIACCRNPKGADALDELAEKTDSVKIEKLDVNDHTSIDALKDRLGNHPVDILINSAGIFGKTDPSTTGFADQMFGKSNFERDWIDTFRTTVIGPMKMVKHS